MMKIRNFRSLSIIALLVLLVLGFCISCGCTGDEGGDAEPAPATTAPVDTGTTGPATPAADAVHFTELYPFFPTPTSNWVADDPLGYTMSAEGTTWTWAERTYEHKTDDIMVDIVIQDTAGTDQGYWQMWDTFTGEFDTPDFSLKSTTVQGYPAWVAHDKAENTYTQYVAVNDRFLVWINVDGSSAKEAHLTVFNTQMNYKALAALA